MEKLKENLEKNLNVQKEEITDNEDGSITFLLEETKVTVDEDGKVELGERVPVIKAESIEVENLIIGKTGNLNVTTSPSKITEELIYTSKNTEIASVNGEGEVTGRAEGTATIEVRGKKSGIKGECTVTVEFGVGIKATGENKTYEDNGQAVIPAGFCVVPGCDNISEGLVISDNDEDTEIDKNNVVAKGNQFVWIPVINPDIYKVNEGFEDANVPKNFISDTGYLPDGIEVEAGKDLEKEKELVINKGGFYISRYEAGDSLAKEDRTIESDGQLVSKKDTYVYTCITQNNAIKKAKEFINNENVKSALISSIQWDVVMNFVNGKKDGTDQYYYVTQQDENRHSGNKEKSGQNLADKVCNIYDLEGNVREYVAHKNKYYEINPYILRGGYYVAKGQTASRYDGSGGTSEVNMSFHFVLYVM